MFLILTLGIPTKMTSVPSQVDDVISTSWAAILLASLRIEELAVYRCKYSLGSDGFVLKFHRVRQLVDVFIYVQFSATGSQTRGGRVCLLTVNTARNWVLIHFFFSSCL